MSNPGEFDTIEGKLNNLDSSEFKHAFVSYPEMVVAVQKATELLRRVDEIIDLVNSGGLPPGYMIITKGDPRTPLWAIPEGYIKEEAKRSPNTYPEHVTMIYRPNEDGEYVLDGELATESSTQVFLGDRILKLESGQLVIINTEHNVGITPSGEVDIIDLINDRPYYTTGKEQEKRFAFFLDIIDGVKDGTKVHEDLSWG